jgi:hypothetical protein
VNVQRCLVNDSLFPVFGGKMNRAFGHLLFICILIMCLITIILGCNYPGFRSPTPQPVLPPATPSPAPTAVVPTEQSHILIPFNPSGRAQTIHDQVNKAYASQRRAYGGDEYRTGRFERPFDKTMTYLGYLDIVKSTMARIDDIFIYVTIQVADPVAMARQNPAYYGLELDLNLDGRSRYLIRGTKPANEKWSSDGVDVWESSSSNSPVASIAAGIPVTGAYGFDVSLLRAGKGQDIDLAWIRMSPGLPDTVEIAFKNSLIGGEKGKFIWRPFTDGAPFEPRLYDLQNSFTLEQAGSPIIGEMYYPLNEVYAVDNTCRVASGYEATGREPGICPLTAPPEQPEQPESEPGEPNLPLGHIDPGPY